MAHEIPKHTVPEIPGTAMILGTQKSLKEWKTILSPLKKYVNGALMQYWVNPVPVQFSPYINVPNWKWNPSFLTLIIKRLGHLVFMGAIQCSAKRVYPPKDFRYQSSSVPQRESFQ